MSTRHCDSATDDNILEMVVEHGDQASAVVRVTGEVDEHTVLRFEAQLREQLNPTGALLRLVVDLSAVDAMTAEGLTALLEVERCCFARSVRFCLVGCSAAVLEQLDTAGCTDHFRHYSTVAEATG